MSLDLDQRQRAMLLEMGVRVWWPATATPEPPQTATQTIAPHAIAAGSAANKRVHVQATPAAPAAPARGIDGVASMDWTALRQAVAQCQACGMHTGRRAPVFGRDAAPRRADWLVLGEPVDDDEERQGTPLVGAAGQLLDNMLKAVGVSRSDSASKRTPSESAYVTNCVKCRPAAARNPRAADLQSCETFLQREIALVRPKIILAMGRFAAQALLQGDAPETAALPLGKLRAKVHAYQGVAVIVTYAPAYLLRTPQDKARAWADLCLARHTLSTMPP